MARNYQIREDRDQYGRFQSSQGGQRGWENEQEGPESGRRGIAAMNPETQREFASRNARASRGGQDYDDDENFRLERRFEGYEGNETDYEHREPGRRRGFASLDFEQQREIASEGARAPRRGQRGFAAMDPEEQREIASEGGRAPHRGPRGFAAMDPDEQREIASEGGRAPRQGPRGFAAMNERQRREIASEGGRTPREGPRGFAAMDERRQRQISSRGGRASHGGRNEDERYAGEPRYEDRGWAWSQAETRNYDYGSEPGQRRGFAAQDPRWQREGSYRGGWSPFGGGGRDYGEGYGYEVGRAYEDERGYEPQGGGAERGSYEEGTYYRGGGRRGYADIPREQRRELASHGGRGDYRNDY
jgi:general stress protein YciG